MIDLIATLVVCAATGIGCYVFGNMRAMRIIEYRERQADRLFGDDEPPEDKPEAPVYRKCLCGHTTTSHNITAFGDRKGCTVSVNNSQNCACKGYIPDPSTRLKS